MDKINRDAGELKILAIGAHPDDFDIGAGMTLFNHVDSGDSVEGVICTNGEMGGTKEKRVEEAFEAAERLGLDGLYFLDFPDTNIPFKGVLEALELLVNSLHPDVVYTHFPNDTHQDHKIVSEATSTACRKGVPAIMRYMSVSTVFSSFTPNIFYIGSQDDYLRKEDLLEAYRSQIDRGIVNLETIRSSSSFYANFFLKSPGYFAEPFIPNHLILNPIPIYNRRVKK